MKFDKLGRFFLWLPIIAVFSCTAQQETYQLDENYSTLKPTVTFISTITPFVPSSLPSKTPTQTPIPTNTIIPSPTSRTPVPVQNLELEEAKQKIDFLSWDSNCQLSCFNGLTPGISSAWEVQEFFAKLGLSDELLADENGYMISRDSRGFWNIDPIQGSIGGPVPYLLTSNYLGKPFIGVEWNNNLVTHINLGPLPYRDWISISRMYNELGKPDTIKIAVDAGEGFTVSYVLHLYFSSNKTYISYFILSTSITEVCINSNSLIDVIVAIGSPSLPNLGYEMKNWHGLNGLNFDDLVDKVGTGDFCLPYVVEK